MNLNRLSARPGKPAAQSRGNSTLARIRQVLTVGITAIALGGLAHPALAGDPFRTTNPKAIDDGTEAAFEAIFEQGNYQAAKVSLESASEAEPLAHMLRAVVAYLESDTATFQESGSKTLAAATDLQSTDPLRGYLYAAVGYTLEGLYKLEQAGSIEGPPAALQTLQIALANLDAAEQIAPNDPELNLIKGHIDLLIAANLPFASPDAAIKKLQTYAAPAYVSQRGIAMGYRDMKRFDQAIAAVDKALAAAPNNPELFYLKAQILAKQKKFQESLGFFQKALAKQDQLPTVLVQQIKSNMNAVASQVN